MMYEFEPVGGGARVERSFHWRDVPSIGQQVSIDGALYVRVPSVPGLGLGSPARGFVNYTMNPKEAAALGARVNSDGFACFDNKREQDEFVSRTQDTTNPVVNVR